MIQHNSQKIQPGDTFVCMPHPQAIAHCQEAEARGAAQIIGLLEIAPFVQVSFVQTDNPRQALIDALKYYFHNQQPQYCYAVTGSNGKSSVVHFLHQIWSYYKESHATVGTLGFVDVVDLSFPRMRESSQHAHLNLDPRFREDDNIATAMPPLTSPDPVDFHKILAQTADRRFFAFEASSHGLDQQRCDGCVLDGAAFTNLSHDHLDYHHTMANYFKAKKRLFDVLLPKDAVRVINADDPYGAALVTNNNCIAYGRSNGYAIHCDDQKLYFHDAAINIKELKIVGAFQLYNLMAAIGLASLRLPDLKAALPHITNPCGRLEEVWRAPRVFVDYAHTPDALQKALLALRPYGQRLIVVFGCGGDRDKDKRPMMGSIAQQYADVVIVTDDNPRYESPASIRQAIMQGCPRATEIEDRKKAIEKALSMAASSDIILIAGKGHETYQWIEGETLPFSDKEVVKELCGETKTGGQQPKSQTL